MEKHKNFDIALLRSLKTLNIVAKQVVEGVIAGRHKTPYHGFNLEFAQHRSYFPGDDLRHINWKIYGKSDKLNIKLYEEETDLRGFMLVDASASMAYSSGKKGIPKYNYASHLASCLAYVLVAQQDLIGLEIFDEKTRAFLPPMSGINQFGNITSVLENTFPENNTNIHMALKAYQNRMKKRGLLILISDLLEDPDLIIKRLKEIRQRKNEVIVFQVLDPEEVNFNFRNLCIFKDLETGQEVVVDPMELRRDYLAKMSSLIERYKDEFAAIGIDYECVTTDQDLAFNVKKYLTKRARFKK